MESVELKLLYKKYDLVKTDFYQHKHYTIITRQGIDKIQAKERIFIEYDIVACTPEFCVVKARANKDNAKIETLGSAKYGGKVNEGGKWVEIGNSTTWYIAEMAEKRAMSRAVLKLTGFYELGVFGEDESEDFKKPYKKESEPKDEGISQVAIDGLTNAVGQCNTLADLQKIWTNKKEMQTEAFFIKLKNDRKQILIDNGITE